MSKTAITSPELALPVGPFSQAVNIDGFLFFSGQVAQDPATGKVVEGGIVPETERVFQNLSAVLKAASKSFDDVVRAGVFLTNMTDFAAMNGIYAKYFSQPFPARTTIAVCRATTWGLRRDRSRCQGLRRRRRASCGDLGGSKMQRLTVGSRLRWVEQSPRAPSALDCASSLRLAIPNPREVLRRSGLRVSGIGGEVRADVIDIAAVEDYGKGDQFDLILLATKAQDTLEVAPHVLRLLAPGGVMLPIQNGGVARVLADGLGEDRILGGFSNLGATMVEPGVYEQKNAGHLVIGELAGGVSERIDRVARTLGRAIEVKASSNITGAIWSKLLINCSVTTLGAPEAARYLAPVANALAPIGASVLTRSDEVIAEDIAGMVQLGVPGLSPSQDSRFYFSYHHSATDTLDKVNVQQLNENAAVMAVTAYALADASEAIPRRK